ncbi:4'-phosphopantetheinyl transferase superfamily protein [Micromonospora sp. R77]|uniref:4'-phosphopantetheinyl transferase family protein n=1 Tax=Micromonospora sp. R77 TaxID=2925836 RepID=UPI001F607804|nr:4'-phosphopantetheinyl transferase superfamily protein [Micromonospora sp. R77]MCI4066430.1 4'-phosphopantetheinyl transferase superfamily protein [Micromonospora sp. R77]
MNTVQCLLRQATVGPGTDDLLGLLDPAERARAAGLRHAVSRAEFVLGRATARLLVAEGWGPAPSTITFRAVCRTCAGPHGRLEVATPDGVVHVSVSHSAGRVAVAAALGVRCGVDVEKIALRGAKPPVTALSTVERAVFDAVPPAGRTAAFVRYWTRKEAVLKATGDGLTVAPATLTVSGPTEPPRVLSWTDRPAPELPVHLSDVDAGEGFLGALATLEVPHTVIG